MPEAEYRVTFPFDETELRRATWTMLRHTRFKYVPLIASGIGLVATGLTIASAVREGTGALPALITATPWVVLALFWGFLPWITTRFQVRSIGKKLPALAGEQTRVISDSGFYFATPSMAQSYAWSAVQRVVETDEFLIFYVTPSYGHYVPKHAIPVELEAPIRALLAREFAARPARLQLRGWAD